MGSGISLSKEQVVHIIERELSKEFYDSQTNRPIYTDEGYEIYYDFTDEANYINTLKKLNEFLSQEKRKERNSSNKY